MKNERSSFIPADADAIASATALPVTVFESIPSTNTALTELIKNGQTHRQILVARSQTSGKGRLGRSFSSEHGGIYFSFNFTIPAHRAPYEARLVTPLAGVAVTSALTELYGIGVGLKWVNDVIAYGKKLGGILTEAVTVGSETHVTVGIGINAVNSDFPDTATSLSRVTDGTFDASAVISRTVVGFFSRLPGIADVHREYRSRLVHLGAPVTVHRFDGTPDVPAVAVDVNEACELIVRTPDGTHTALSSGEVSVIIEKTKQIHNFSGGKLWKTTSKQRMKNGFRLP